MGYIDGFVIAVPSENRETFIHHADMIDSLFMEMGAIRVMECWSDDVPEGEVTDFRKAVKAKPDETVVFSWIEWPDKETRDAAMKRMQDLFETDDRFDPEKNPVPFDGKRMIYGGFMPVVDKSKPASA